MLSGVFNDQFGSHSVALWKKSPIKITMSCKWKYHLWKSCGLRNKSLEFCDNHWSTYGEEEIKFVMNFLEQIETNYADLFYYWKQNKVLSGTINIIARIKQNMNFQQQKRVENMSEKYDYFWSILRSVRITFSCIVEELFHQKFHKLKIKYH